MKKFALLLAGVLSLGAGVICACTNGEVNNPPDPDDPGIVDPPDDNDTDFTEALGAYALFDWVSEAGVLNLAEGTLEGTQSFEITDVTGADAEIVISCTVDGVDYTISLNDAGALEMISVADNQLYSTFLVEASRYAGAWYSADETSYYYVISDTVDDEGYFSWRVCNRSGVTTAEPYQAVTIFESQGENYGITFYVPETNYFFYYSGEAVYMNDGTSMGTLEVEAYTPVFSSMYLNAEGEELSIDLVNSTVTYQGQEMTATAGFGAFGAGIWFRDEDTSVEHALIYTNEETKLVSLEGSEVYAAYNPEWLPGDENGEGEWSIGTNLANGGDVVFNDDQNIIFEGTSYQLSHYIDDGELVYSFTVPGTANDYTYVIRAVEGSEDVFYMESNRSQRSGYYFRENAKRQFVQTFTSNSEILTIDEDYALTITTKDVDGDDVRPGTGSRFTYLEDLGTIAYSYTDSGLGTSGSVTFNLALVNTQGIYWTIVGTGGSYAAYSTYLTEDYLPTAIETMTQALNEGDDYFTTGGLTPETLRFNFETGIVTVDGADSYYFSWGYGAVRTTDTPELYVTINEGEMVPDSHYNRYTLFPSSTGLDAVLEAVDIDSSGNISTSDEQSRFYVAQNTFEELFGTTFVYYGRYVQSSISIDEEGGLNLSSYDASTGNTNLLKVDRNDYSIHIGISGGTETITLVYAVDGQNYIVEIVDRLYATYDSLVYCIPDLAEVIGMYSNGSEYIILGSDGSVNYNGVDVNVTGIVSNPGEVIVTFMRSNAVHTATFTGGQVTVASGDSQTIYSNKIDTDLSSFVGTYIVAVDDDTDITVGVSATVGGVNEQVSLTTTINGVIRTPSVQLSEDGKLQIYFTAFDFAAGGTVRCTLTLDGDRVSVNATVGSSGNTEVYDVSDWDYSDFNIEETQIGQGTLSCVVKEGAPLYLLNGVMCDGYEVSINGNVKTLTLDFNGTDVVITNNNGSVSVA